MKPSDEQTVGTPELSPCPFCGSEPRGDVQGPYPPEIVQVARIRCPRCHVELAASGRAGEPWPRLVALWNQRALASLTSDESLGQLAEKIADVVSCGVVARERERVILAALKGHFGSGR